MELIRQVREMKLYYPLLMSSALPMAIIPSLQGSQGPNKQNYGIISKATTGNNNLSSVNEYAVIK
jgi:hypothetical protein